MHFQTLLMTLSLLHAPAADTVKKVKGTGDFGFVMTSGNTSVTTMNIGEKVVLTTGAWSVAQAFGVVYGRTNGVTSSSLWTGALRGDRAITKRVGLFVLGQYERNTFAGFRSRTTPSLGIALTLVDAASDKLNAEIGGGYTWQKNVTPTPDAAFASGRGALRYVHQLSTKSSVSQAVEFLPNFKESKDLRINSETSLTAPVTRTIGLKASYLVHYDGLPQPTFKKTDRILTTGIQVTF